VQGRALERVQDQHVERSLEKVRLLRHGPYV
jgi:hypothetical protein